MNEDSFSCTSNKNQSACGANRRASDDDAEFILCGNSDWVGFLARPQFGSGCRCMSGGTSTFAALEYLAGGRQTVADPRGVVSRAPLAVQFSLRILFVRAASRMGIIQAALWEDGSARASTIFGKDGGRSGALSGSRPFTRA